MSSVAVEPPSRELRIFISYRREDSSGWPRALYQQLADRFGTENVFLDHASLRPGTNWRRDIGSKSGSSDVFVVVIGPRWAEFVTKRIEAGEEDPVREEIEAALRAGPKVSEILPVLVDGAEMPSQEDLRHARSLHPMLDRHALELRPSQWDADLKVLIERIASAAVAAEEVVPPAPASPVVGDEPSEARPAEPPPEARPEEDEEPIAPPPDRRHYEEVAAWMLEEGSAVVPFLGPGANSSDRTSRWHDLDSQFLPDSDELAEYLSAQVGPQGGPMHLATASQAVVVARGKRALFKALAGALPSRHPPGSVHRFLAELPQTLERLGAPSRPQLIVTTNYDDSLERAFDQTGHPYHLAVYIAAGPDSGRFVHIPLVGEPHVVDEPSRYTGFPFDAFGGVEETVIMKIHGAVDNRAGRPIWQNNYVITEDDYIDYMSVGDIESIVPQQLLAKLRNESHFLFLGHSMRDWNLRVFLRRIFPGGKDYERPAWSIQRDPDLLDEKFWLNSGVELSAVSLESYVEEMSRRLPDAVSKLNGGLGR
jgi:hypothetical protein